MSNQEKLEVGKVYENPIDDELIRITDISDKIIRYSVIQSANGSGENASMLKSFAEKNLIPA